MNSLQNRQTIYIRKLNGLGEKISVESNLTVRQLKQVVQSLPSLQQSSVKQTDFNLIFKGKNITQKSSCTLKQLQIPSNGIIHLVFTSQQQPYHPPAQTQVLPDLGLNVQSQPTRASKPVQIGLRVMLNGSQHQLTISPTLTVLQLKKKISIKLNLIYESLILSHLGVEMLNDRTLRDYCLADDTLVSLRFNLQKGEKKKLQSRMVSSVTFSDENNQPNKDAGKREAWRVGRKAQQVGRRAQQVGREARFKDSSNKSIDSGLEEEDQDNGRRVGNSLIGREGFMGDKGLMGNNAMASMYKSDINGFGTSQGFSKAALMFKNALHQKIVQTESVVSGSFSEDATLVGSDPNSIMITVKNQEYTKQYVFQCAKNHQILDIKEILFQLQKISSSEKLEISLEEDLFQSIDLSKSGCITLNEIVKKMGKQRAVFIYRII